MNWSARRASPDRPVLIIVLLALLWVAAAPAAQNAIGPGEWIGDGVLLVRLDDESLLEPRGPVAIQALRIDPVKNQVGLALAQDTSPARETVAAIATRRGAIAAVNAGFFSLTNGAPAGVLKVAGRVLGRSRRGRGAVGFTRRGGATRLLFDRVSIGPPVTTLRTCLGSPPADWQRAQDIVGGAGLLMLKGREITEWKDERISAGFDTTRHPRTMIGVDRDNQIWLVTVDGRQPSLSLGMNFAELKRLARLLGLRSALNLDGGGSTTMVLKGGLIANHPSDAEGPRAVSDAIVVLPANSARPNR
ncbi:MAG: phosphodiester glycosidase family protein [Vicinamibacterales bacterium]